MPRRTILRRRRAQGGCLSFAIGTLAVAALALVVAIMVTNRLRPSGDIVAAPGPTPTGGSYVDVNNLPVEDNQLVLTGEYNDVGAMKTTNVKDSYRLGAELTAGVKITDWFRWSGNLVLSRNKILNYKQYIDLYDDQDNWNWVGQDSIEGTTTIAFSPSVTAMSLFEFEYKGFYASIQTNVTGRQYLDNTQDVHAMLKAYTTTNLHLQYQLPMTQWCGNKKGVPQLRLMCQLNNIFNEKYASNGGADNSRFADGSRCVWYYAQAGINVHAGFQIDF